MSSASVSVSTSTSTHNNTTTTSTTATITAVPNQELTDIILQVPIHKHIGIVLDSQDYENKTAAAHFQTHHELMTPTDTLHGGVIYTCCDSVAYLALIPHFSESENAATIAISVNVIRAVSGTDKRVELHARVLSKGQRTAFIESSMWYNNKLIATAIVTKAIIKQLPKQLAKATSKL